MVIRQRIWQPLLSAPTSSPCWNAHEYGGLQEQWKRIDVYLGRHPALGLYERSALRSLYKDILPPPILPIVHLCPPHEGEGCADGDEILSVSLEGVEVASLSFGWYFEFGGMMPPL
jgi:hypothetical protein